MATIKRCDTCREYWDPAEHMDVYGKEDMNRCVVSVIAPRDGSDYTRSSFSTTYEVCQDCAREVIRVLDSLGPVG
jgi:hypothetical protein